MNREPSAFRGGRVTIALLSTVVLAVTGTLWWTSSLVIGGFTVSRALAEANIASSPGDDRNILLMGLDSRKDQNGNDLPPELLAQLQAGDSSSGGYNTNTLILVHVPADGGDVVSFSIPRDNYVPLVGVDSQAEGKIKEAYGLRKAEVVAELTAAGQTDQAVIEAQSRESGRAATLATVERLVGVPIDHFAEVSLAGFYNVTAALGGVEVCLNAPVQDSFSGANFPAGVQRLDAAQSMSFVRQRHGLADGDIDRTARQQAFIAGVMVQLENQGVLGDVPRLQALISAAQQNVVVSDGWDLQAFAAQAGAISGSSFSFTTLPILGFDTINGQAVNIVDSQAIRAQVQQAFGQSLPEPADQGDATDLAAGSDPSEVAFTAPQTPPTDLDAPAPDATVAQAPQSSETIRGGQIPCVD